MSFGDWSRVLFSGNSAASWTAIPRYNVSTRQTAGKYHWLEALNGTPEHKQTHQSEAYRLGQV
jgi:hypothetical protein